MIDIVCVLRKSKDFDVDYVEHLKDGIDKNLSIPYNFTCLTDTKPNCDYLPLTENLPGWWNQIEIFKPQLFQNQVFYFDLDQIIVGNIDELCSYTGTFGALHRFNRNKDMSTSFMSFNPKKMSYLWEEYKTGKYNKFMVPPISGENKSIALNFFKPNVSDWDCISDLYPNTFLNYKVQYRKNPRKCKILWFHCKPRPRDVDWLKNDNNIST
ncbi:MAG: hypothetical protein U9M89_02775 [Patescibacteria group bacterium]|nr:hypothetical protein [Patescibacteria group bacterium]